MALVRKLLQDKRGTEMFQRAAVNEATVQTRRAMSTLGLTTQYLLKNRHQEVLLRGKDS